MPPTPTRKKPSGHPLQVLRTNTGLPIQTDPVATWNSAWRSAHSRLAWLRLSHGHLLSSTPAHRFATESTRPANHAPVPHSDGSGAMPKAPCRRWAAGSRWLAPPTTATRVEPPGAHLDCP